MISQSFTLNFTTNCKALCSIIYASFHKIFSLTYFSTVDNCLQIIEKIKKDDFHKHTKSKSDHFPYFYFWRPNNFVQTIIIGRLKQNKDSVKILTQEIYPYSFHFIKSNFFLLFHQFIIFFDIVIWPSFYITIRPLTFFQVFQFSENRFNLDHIDWKPYFSIFSIWAVWLVAMRMNKNAGKLQNKNWNDQNRGIVIGLNSLKHNILHPGSWVLHSKFPSSLNNYNSCLSASFL